MKSSIRTFRLLLLFMAAAISISSADEVYSKTQAANRLYKQGNYEAALKLYEDALLLSPADPKLKMNKGSALYQLGDYENAEKNYEGALSAKEKKEQAIAHYNMGNILFRKGEALQKQGDMKAQEQYKSALEHYIQSLDLHPTDFDAKWNLQLAHQRIKQMEQQQQQQQKDQNNKDNKDQKNDNQQQNKDRQQQQKNEQDQQNRQDKQQQQDEDKKDQQQQQQQKEDKQKEQQQQPQPAREQQDKEDMKKEEAKRIIELYADDADSLNKPTRKGVGKQRQPERDW